MNLGAPGLIALVIIVLIVGGLFFLPRVMYSIAPAVGKGYKDGMHDKNP